ncbi:hypothetical protein HRbin40_02503 [bacterium HR40]|nr:hypothetical protein HRbin40_02503 [bacterium HR40]
MSDRNRSADRVPALAGSDTVWGRDPRCPVKRSWLVALLIGEELQLAEVDDRRIRPLARLSLADPRAARSELADQLAADGLRRLPVVLRLPPRSGILLRERLPPCRARERSGLIAHRIALRTPFSPEETVFCAWLLARQADGSCEMAVAVAPRRRLEEARSRLFALGLVPRVVDFAIGDPFAPPRFDLGSAAGGKGWSHGLRPLAIAASLLALVAAAVLGQLGQRERQMAAELRASLAGLPPLAAPASAEMAAIDELRADLARLDGEAVEHPPPLFVFEIVSRILPDDAWLESATLSGRELVLRGYAADATALLRLFEDTPWFEATRFDVPSTRVEMVAEGGQRVVERFGLVTRIADLAEFVP